MEGRLVNPAHIKAIWRRKTRISVPAGWPAESTKPTPAGWSTSSNGSATLSSSTRLPDPPAVTRGRVPPAPRRRAPATHLFMGLCAS